MNIVKVHNVFVNSNMRASGTSNDFNIALKQPLILTNKNNYFRVKVGKCVIPHVIKQVNSNNNKLYWNIIRPSINIVGYGTITAGNYNINTLLTEVITQIQSSIFASSGISITLTASYNRPTGAATISMTGVDALATTLILKFTQSTTLGLMLGFTNDASLSYTAGFIPTPITSSQHVNVNPIVYLTVRSNTFRGRESYESIVEKDVYTDILAVVPINVAPGNFIIFDGLIYNDIINHIIDKFNIYLGTNDSYSLSLHNLDWSISLIFEEIGITTKDDTLESLLKQPDLTNPLLKQLEDQKQQLLSEVENDRDTYVQHLMNQLNNMDPTNMGILGNL